MKTLSFTKSGIDFSIAYNGGTSFTMHAPGLYEDKGGDYEEDYQPVDKVFCGYEGEGLLKIVTHKYLKVGDLKVGGVKIEDVKVIKEIESIIEENKIERINDKNDREKHRVAPFLDREKFEVFNIGCDSGVIYHKNAEAIKLALKNGATQYDVLRGQRDGSNKYPGQMDDMIPVEFATKVEGKYKAEGYAFLYDEHYCIRSRAYFKALNDLKEQEEKLRESENEVLFAKFEKARIDGKPVLISKVTVPEEQSPLAQDGEGDMVDICKMAMPDGTIKEMCFHNY